MGSPLPDTVFGTDRRVLALALAGDHARKGESGAQLSVLTVSFGLGIASGQLLAGGFVPFGFVVPFVIGALFAAASVVLVWTQVYAPPSRERS